jgi:hypothetical protein
MAQLIETGHYYHYFCSFTSFGFSARRVKGGVNVTHEILFHCKPKITKGKIQIVAIGGDGTINEVVTVCN